MPALKTMPEVVVSKDELAKFGVKWQEKQSLSRKAPESSSQLGNVFDKAVGKALAEMLGGVPVVTPSSYSLTPIWDPASQAQPQTETGVPAKKPKKGKKPKKSAIVDIVEVGPVRIVGGVRPQNFDVGYRPDGVRFAFDSKTLNDAKSVTKNYQNMINDLGTEATTVHTRFPYAIVAFMVVIPDPCLATPQRLALTRTLERMTARLSPLDSAHKAEAISLVVWDPMTGDIAKSWPTEGSPLRIEAFSGQVERAYVERYKGLPPHDADDPRVDERKERAAESSVRD